MIFLQIPDIFKQNKQKEKKFELNSILGVSSNSGFKGRWIIDYEIIRVPSN